MSPTVIKILLSIATSALKALIVRWSSMTPEQKKEYQAAITEAAKVPGNEKREGNHFPLPVEIIRKLDQILGIVKDIQRKEEAMSKELDALTLQVQANTDAEQSAIVLLKGLADQIAAAKTDPVALQALSDTLKASADNLAEAVVANTPAA
jgi:hypothetical protein